VHLSDESNLLRAGQAQGNRYDRSPPLGARVTVFKRGESDGCDPKPDDLRLGKVKRAERHVEAC
jgi:hypothetical protein